GAIHLNFSDFTDDKLAKIIPSRDTRILIYCNNNFTDNVAPVPVKRIELALNVP
ncbi:MAG TPA: rhodanese-like domain-containing protein, partial [Erythrobacter sp.]|nr:rhodanese-like domain-containing protein [Erythrobacter sp.]